MWLSNFFNIIYLRDCLCSSVYSCTFVIYVRILSWALHSVLLVSVFVFMQIYCFNYYSLIIQFERRVLSWVPPHGPFSIWLTALSMREPPHPRPCQLPGGSPCLLMAPPSKPGQLWRLLTTPGLPQGGWPSLPALLYPSLLDRYAS